MTDWKAIRCEFPALDQWTYLNTATYGQLPKRTVAAVTEHFARRDALACSDFLTWFDDADRLRASIGRLIGARSSDIGFVSNAANALAILLNGLDWRDGDEVITLENEFPNNLYAPWMVKGARFVQTPWERFYDAITPRTRLVILSMLNYSTGLRPPLEELGPYLRGRGILLYVDGSQGVGALRFDARAIRPAMLAVHGYKWLLSPTGAAFFYIDPELSPKIPPPVIGWRSHKDWRNVDNLHHGQPEFGRGADRYEGGMIPHALLYGMEQSVEMMLEIGPQAIEERVLALSEFARQALQDCGAVVANGASPILAARLEGRDVSALARDLEQHKILVSARQGNLRVSLHFYNDESDVERLCERLRA